MIQRLLTFFFKPWGDLNGAYQCETVAQQSLELPMPTPERKRQAFMTATRIVAINCASRRDPEAAPELCAKAASMAPSHAPSHPGHA